MRPLALAPVLLLLALPVLAQKPAVSYDPGPLVDGREGGETIADAIEVPFPFTDSGATCDNLDDYDEVCPYPGSTAPDVVYTFVPEWDTVADVDLWGSTYDTKVYVYDENLALVACNDDFYPDYVSKIENLSVYAGMRYYLIIDGYGTSCGQYTVTVCEYLPCDFFCYGEYLEGEPPFIPGYVDQYNAGCDVEPPIFQQLPIPDDEEWFEFCGESGYRVTGDQWERDSDWFQFTAAGDQVIIVCFAAYSWATAFDVLFLDGCDDVSLLPSALGSCGSNEIVVNTVPGQLLTLRVRPLHPELPGCSHGLLDEYIFWIRGGGTPVAAERHTWSDVKGLYR